MQLFWIPQSPLKLSEREANTRLFSDKCINLLLNWCLWLFKFKVDVGEESACSIGSTLDKSTQKGIDDDEPKDSKKKTLTLIRQDTPRYDVSHFYALNKLFLSFR